MLEALSEAGGAQSVHDLLEIPCEDVFEPVHRETDPVIRHPVLREVVRANLGRAVTSADLQAPLSGPVGFLARYPHVEQAAPQHLERLRLVLVL